MNGRYTAATFGRELVCVAFVAAMMLPLYLLVVLSLKRPDQAASAPFSLPLHPDTANFKTAWTGGGAYGSTSLGGAFINSLIITAGTVAVLVVGGSLAGYVLARRQAKLAWGLYLLFLLGLIFPLQAALIPVYVLINHLGLVGSPLGVVLVDSGLFLPLTVFLYAGFIRAVPRDYDEAAITDGAGHLRVFWQIIFPLVRPVTATVIILNTVAIWNDFFTPLVFLGGSGHETLPVQIYAFVGQYTSTTQWGVVFASVLLATAPMIALFFAMQRYLVRGFAGGIRG